MGINSIHHDSTREAQILDEIRRLVRFLRVSARSAEKQLGISGAQLFVLQTLAQSDEPLSVNDLAEHTRTHQSSVSVVVRKLVNQKLIRRARARTDGRQLDLTLSPNAKALLQRSPNSAQHQLIKALEGLKPRDQQSLANLLGRVNGKLGLDRQNPPLLFEDENASPNISRRRAARRV